jgi:hypothetical protein
MATPIVRVLLAGGLSCGHPAWPTTTRVAPRVGDVHCGLCALASIHLLLTEIALTVMALGRSNTR